eukprot:6489128-Ditylum_brightwellii.AAC.1
MATTKGCLVVSTKCGCNAITQGSGATSVILAPYADDSSDEDAWLPPVLDALVKDVIGIGGHDAGIE